MSKENVNKVEKPKNNTKKIIFGVLGFVLIIVLGFFSWDFYQKNQVSALNSILEKNEFNAENCAKIWSYDINRKNKYLDEEKLKEFKKICEKDYSLEKKFEKDEKLVICRDLVSKSDENLAKKYIEIKDLDKKRNECFSSYFEPKIKVSEFFNSRKNLKTTLNINFKNKLFDFDNIDQTTDKLDEKVAQTLIANSLYISPKVEINPETDIELDDEIISLNLNLKPKTSYEINFKNIKKDFSKKLKFETPDKKYFSLRIKNPVTLFTKNNLPVFELWDYNTEKTDAKIKLCRVSEEDYAKIEISEKYFKDFGKEFYSKFSDKIAGKDCTEKTIKVKNSKEKKLELSKISFDFDEILDGKNGLYFLSFTDKEIIKKYPSKPLFFGIVDSNILMKISKNGEGFFFVNDLKGNPLANQKIYAYFNNYFKGEKKRNRKTGKREVEKINSPLDGKVFSGALLLGETDKDGILKINLDEKMRDFYGRTFGDVFKGGEWSREDFYKTFLVKSVGQNNLSYLVSAWNAGIEPWNFGYSLGRSDRNESKFKNSFKLDSYVDSLEQKKINGHIFTDRLLYLPGETVYIKGVFRENENLTIPKNDEKFNLKIADSSGEEFISKEISLNEFGSFSESIELPENAKLGNYHINFTDKNENNIIFSGFNVEIFKNPKFKNEVSLETEGLNGEFVKISGEEKESKNSRWRGKNYIGKFKIKGFVKSDYYSGGNLKNVDFSYKVYKQYYWDNSYWDNCYYGCYREPTKMFYTEGKGRIDENGIGNFEIPVKFKSSYDDYKYIVEVSVTDEAGDSITGSNSIIAKLPSQYKGYNNSNSFFVEPNSRFVKVGEKLKITGGLNLGKWQEEYNDRYAVVIKKKNYTNKKIKDVNGFDRNVAKTSEEIKEILLVNDKNFQVGEDGKINYEFQPKENGEYIFEYGDLDIYSAGRYFGKEGDLVTKNDLKKVFEEFAKDKKNVLNYTEKRKICKEYNKKTGIGKGGKTYEYNGKCKLWGYEDIERKLYLKKFINADNYFPVIAYGGKENENPVKNDNKINIISEKVSYKIGETAKILVRLPVSKSKILMTIEKKGVKKTELFDMNSNTFFKEIEVDDNFVPNTYISVFMIDTENKIPEYKIGYTEIVVDKTDRKAFIDLKTDKQKYKPRENVKIDISVKDGAKKGLKSELTVMVVDDSLISLMGNINPNILEKIFVKLPFSIQTSMSNIAMIRNYYFSRKGIVGGSGFGDFKGGDSAVSTRNIFKNTAFYNANVITDENGNANINFNLPDNLTNFRVMVVSNSKDNHFGYSEKFIEIRKNVVLEDKTPLILRKTDKATIGVNLFNNTGKDMGFKVNIKAEGAEIQDSEKNITLKKGEKKFISWDIEVAKNDLDSIKYTISALGDSVENSDKLENSIEIKSSPVLLNSYFKSLFTHKEGGLQTEKIVIPENTDYQNSKVEINLANNRIYGIKSIAKSLAVYPYGCVEQLTSTTLPNVVLKNLMDLMPGIYDEEKLQKNIDDGLKKILSRQNDDGGFAYWQGDNVSDLHYTPYVLRGLVYMKNSGEKIDDKVIEKAVSYLEKNYKNSENKAEILWSLANAGKLNLAKIGLKDLGDFEVKTEEELLDLTYALVLKDKEKYKEKIEENISKLWEKSVNFDNNSYSRSYRSDDFKKATLVSLMMDYDSEKYIYEINDALLGFYEKNWESYYYSTWTKNAVFMDFYKYLEKNKNSSKTNLSFSIGNKKDVKISLEKANSNKIISYKLSDLVSKENKNLDFSLENLTEKSTIYADIKVDFYPENIEKIKAYSNGVEVRKEVYEVLDETKLNKCRVNYYNWNDKEQVDCSQFLKKLEGNIYKKGKLYKAKIIVNFGEKKRHNVTIEDYLPGSFRVINSNFKTESSSIRKASNSWSWNHIEARPNVMMANVSSRNGKERVFEYYFRAEFAGSFVNPPVSVYEMYNPKYRAYSEFERIEVE